MMKYLQLRFAEPDAGIREVLIARLAEEGFESFEEDAANLIAYIQEDGYTEAVAQAIQEMHHGSMEVTEIPQQNWNAEWEAGFQPVLVEGFCTIRAVFHAADTTVPYDIIITPKMSFGTGHHTTTRLMIQQMKDIGFTGKDVLDFGTGTGVLAILAKKLGAAHILAIDTDEWSYENALENAAANDVSGIDVSRGSLELAEGCKFDVILANINRHVLLQYMQQMRDALKEEGLLIMSGILESDEQILVSEAMKAGFKNCTVHAEDKWLCMVVS